MRFRRDVQPMVKRPARDARISNTSRDGSAARRVSALVPDLLSATWARAASAAGVKRAPATARPVRIPTECLATKPAIGVDSDHISVHFLKEDEEVRYTFSL